MPFTFWLDSVVIASPLGTRPAVLCFFTSRTDTTGMATWKIKEKRVPSGVWFSLPLKQQHNESSATKTSSLCAVRVRRINTWQCSPYSAIEHAAVFTRSTSFYLCCIMCFKYRSTIFLNIIHICFNMFYSHATTMLELWMTWVVHSGYRKQALLQADLDIAQISS